jgi:hypothetical protein
LEHRTESIPGSLEEAPMPDQSFRKRDAAIKAGLNCHTNLKRMSGLNDDGDVVQEGICEWLK